MRIYNYTIPFRLFKYSNLSLFRCYSLVSQYDALYAHSSTTVILHIFCNIKNLINKPILSLSLLTIRFVIYLLISVKTSFYLYKIYPIVYMLLGLLQGYYNTIYIKNILYHELYFAPLRRRVKLNNLLNATNNTLISKIYSTHLNYIKVIINC